MGRKLTSWERNQREREKKEKAAASRAETAARRAKERERKDKLLSLERDLGSAIVELFNLLLNNLTNLTASIDVKRISAQDGLNLPKSISFKYPGDLTYSDLVSDLNDKSFVSNKAIPKIKRNMNLKYESYKSSYGSFFGNIFGKTKKEYKSFIDQASIDFKQISEKEKKRKLDYENALIQYENELLKFNNRAKEQLKISNTNRLNSYDQIESKIKDYNSILASFKKEIDKIFNSVSSDGFEYIFGSGLPIFYEELDNTFNELIKLVKEFKKDSYDSPSKNLKYGLSISNEGMHLFIKYKESYFPLPNEKQINSVKNGYSIQSLTKSNRENISKNLMPGAALVYAAYAFNTSKDIKDLTLSIGKETFDKKTGTEVTEWEQTYLIQKSSLFSLNFTKIEPVKSLELFKRIEPETFPSKIKWYNKKVQTDQFNSKIQELNSLNDQIRKTIEEFKKEKFLFPMTTDLKKLLDRVNKIKG